MFSEDNIKLIFGIKLKRLRIKRGLSPQDLSQKSGISNSYLNEIEKGKKYPKTDKIAALSSALDVKYDELVSLKLPKEFSAFELLLKSNVLSELPLNMMGLDPNAIVDLLSNSPAKVNAFLNTVVEIARNHDLQTEYFYFSVLRSYQEIKENFFEDTEQSALDFISEYKIDTAKPFSSNLLKDLLIKHYDYTFHELNEDFSQVRSIYKEKTRQLYLNRNLNEFQLLFVLGREIAFNYMQLNPRPYVTTYFNQAGFSEIFNNFLASYFATALVLPQEKMINSLKSFFENKTWNSERFEALCASFGVSSEMFMHRLTNILPKFFKLNSLFFLRLSKSQDSQQYNLTKELHLGRLHNPHASSKNLHYCRRWVSVKVLDEIEKLQSIKDKKDVSLVRAQVSNYNDSKDSYFIISIARPMYPVSGYNTSVSVGILINDTFRRTVNFSKDMGISTRTVSEACETCSIEDCMERAAPASILKSARKQSEFSQNLNNFLNS